MQAGFFVVVLAGQAQGLAQESVAGVGLAEGGVGGGPGEVAAAVGEAGGGASVIRVAAEHRPADALGQRGPGAGRKQEVARLGTAFKSSFGSDR